MDARIAEIISSYFAGQPVTKAWVFGSVARGEDRVDSDIDILVSFDKSAHVGLLKYASMVCDLEDLLHRSIDLVEVGTLMPFAVESAERDKVLVYERAS